MAARSDFDRTGQSFKQGNEAESAFLDLLQKRYPGRRTIPANRQQETIEHWDYWLCNDAQCNSGPTFEVKAVRNIERSDPAAQDKWFPVEYLGILGHWGWAFSKATWLVYQTLGNEWILVHPKDVLDMSIQKIVENAAKIGITVKPDINEILNTTALWVGRSSEALYRLYGRRDRKDALTWVRKEDILALPHEIWKPGEVIQPPPTIKTMTKRGLMGPGGKQLWTTDVSVRQGNKMVGTVPLQGKWDQAKLEEMLKARIPEDKWTAEELINQLRNPQFLTLPPTGGFREWVIWHEKTIRRIE